MEQNVDVAVEIARWSILRERRRRAIGVQAVSEVAVAINIVGGEMV